MYAFIFGVLIHACIPSNFDIKNKLQRVVSRDETGRFCEMQAETSIVHTAGSQQQEFLCIHDHKIKRTVL